MATSWSSSGRFELESVLIANLKTGAVSRVFEKGVNAFPAVFGDWGVRSLGGRWYGFYGAIAPGAGTSLKVFRVDLETGDATPISIGTGRADDFLLDTTGEITGRSYYDENTKRWRAMAGRSGQTVAVEKNSPLGLTGLQGQGRTPGTFVVFDSTGPEDTNEEFELTPGATPTLLFADKDVDQLMFDPTTGLLIGASSHDGADVTLLDPALQHRVDAAHKAFPGLQVALAANSADFSVMVVRTSGGDDSGTYWLIDKGQAQDLMGAYPAIAAGDVAPTRSFAYKAADGMAMEGVLTLPPGKDPHQLPLAVMPHGGPIGVYDLPGFDWWAQAFASRGYAVFQPNYRGSGGHGPAFRKAAYGQLGRKMQSDISDGVAALAAAGTVDPRRACIVGASYGGYAALAGVIFQHGLYRCAVSVAGVSDPGAWMSDIGGNSQSVDGRYARAMFGASYAGDAQMQAISPLRHAEDADAPILLIHGDNDTRVSLANSDSMNTALRKAEKPVSFIKLPGEDHFLSHEATRTQMVRESVAFVEKYNPPN